jgi:hypothetical protein
VPSPADGTVISVAPTVASDPRAPAIVAVVRAHFDDIRIGNWKGYFMQYTEDYLRTLGDQAKVVEGYRSTHVEPGIHLTDLSTLGDGRPDATVTFTSRQDAADGPDGEICTNWTVHFYFQKDGQKYLIDKPPSTYNAEYEGCATGAPS